MAGIDVYFSLGSNMGDRRRNIAEAVRRMEEALSVKVSAVSDILETEPWGFDPGKGEEGSTKNIGLFYNAAMRFEIPQAGQNPFLYAHALLDICKRIEKEMGRIERPLYDQEGKRQYFSRPIDIDLLFYGMENIQSNRLIVPHLGISERDFVKIPLRQIAKCNLIEAFPHIFN